MKSGIKLVGSLVLAGSVAMATVPASARDGWHGGGWHGGGHFDRGWHGGGWRGGWHGDDDDGLNVLLGLGLGLGIGALTYPYWGAPASSSYYGYYGSPYGYGGQTVIVQQPAYAPPPNYYNAPSQYDQSPYVAPQASSAPPPPPGPCLQQREYQTRITVGGKSVPAYGTACLQPDGSWKEGPAQAAQ